MNFQTSLVSLSSLLILVSCTGQQPPIVANNNTPAPAPLTNVNAPIQENKNISIINQNSTPTTSPTNTNNLTVSSTTTTFKGTWFDITYPSNFQVRSISALEDYKTDGSPLIEEAYFTSPDKTTEFYIYSPQWGGETSYLAASSNETLADEETKTTGEGINKTITTWKTFTAKDKSYSRSLVFIREQVDTGSELTHIFGFKYKDNASYEKYRAAYIAFKDSLKQYAD